LLLERRPRRRSELDRAPRRARVRRRHLAADVGPLDADEAVEQRHVLPPYGEELATPHRRSERDGDEPACEPPPSLVVVRLPPELAGIASVAWDSVDGEVTGVNVWETPGAIADFFMERVRSFVEAEGRATQQAQATR
jgi:hypothetical protein